MRSKVLAGLGMALLFAGTAHAIAVFNENNRTWFQQGILTDNIWEGTSANGVVIDGVTLKDGAITVTGASASSAATTWTLAAGVQAISIDAQATDNTRTDGVLEILYDTVTNGGEAVNIDMGVGDAGAGVTANAITIDLDDDTSSNSATINGVSVNVSDASGHSSTTTTAFRSAGAEVGLYVTVPAADKAIVIDASSTAQTQTAGTVDINFGSLTANTSAVDITATHLTGGSGQSVNAFRINLDADSGNASDTLRGIYIDAIDTTATGFVDGITVNGSGTRAAFQANHGYVRIGTGSTADVTPGDDDLYVEGTIEVDGAARFDGAAVLGDAAGDDITITGSIAADVVFKTGISGGADVSVAAGAADTAGSTFDFTGAAGGTASTDQVGKNGGALTITGGAGSAKNGAGATDGDGGDVVLTGGARGGTTGGTEVQGIVRVGNPTVATTKTTNLLAVEGALEVDGVGRFDGAVYAEAGLDRASGAALAIGATNATSITMAGGYGSTGVTVSSAGAISADGAFTLGQADMTISPVTNGGNAGAKNEYIGLPRIKLVGLGGGTSGAAAGKTLALMDDTPDGEYAAVDADTTVTADTTYYKEGAKSLGVLFSVDADAGDGATDTGLAYNFTDDESVGFYVYCNESFVLGDLVLILTDDGGARSLDIPAVTANTWQWVDLTTGVTALANAGKDSISAVTFGLSAAGAAVVLGRATQCYFDAAYKWDSTEEEALGVAIQRDGVLGVVNAAAGTSLAEGTDYFIHEESGSDFIVWITDQSTAFPFALVAY